MRKDALEAETAAKRKRKRPKGYLGCILGLTIGIAATATQFIDWQLSNRYEIFPEWRHRYGDGVTHNTEHVFSLCVPSAAPVVIAPQEHLGYCWLPWREAAGKVFSWSNRDAILMLPHFQGASITR